jgi:CRP/FNR family transcriptional regulator, dissimilatory nitrate respiration regulator
VTGAAPPRVPRRQPTSAEDVRADLTEEARSLLAPYGHKRTFDAGDLLWREADDAGMLVAVETGRVKIYRVLPNGSAVTLFLFGPGDVFGFMPLLDGRPYPASAQALEKVDAMVVARHDLRAAFREDPEVALALVSLLATRLREAFDRIESSSVPEVLPRVAAALATLVPDAKSPGPLLVVELPVRSAEFAAAIGVAPESFSRAVTKLVEARVLHRLAPRRFQVLDVAALRRSAGPTG